MKTFDPQIAKKILQLWTSKLGMKHIIINKYDCYEYRVEYYRLDTFYENDGELLYCIEWAKSYDDAKKNFFEDAFLYSEKLGINKIISEMQDDLTNA